MFYSYYLVKVENHRAGYRETSSSFSPVERLHRRGAGVPEPDAAVLVAGDHELLVRAARVRLALHAARHRPLARAEPPASSTEAVVNKERQDCYETTVKTKK